MHGPSHRPFSAGCTSHCTALLYICTYVLPAALRGSGGRRGEEVDGDGSGGGDDGMLGSEMYDEGCTSEHTGVRARRGGGGAREGGGGGAISAGGGEGASDGYVYGEDPARSKVRREKNKIAARKCRAKKVQFMERMKQVGALAVFAFFIEVSVLQSGRHLKL